MSRPVRIPAAHAQLDVVDGQRVEAFVVDGDQQRERFHIGALLFRAVLIEEGLGDMASAVAPPGSRSPAGSESHPIK